MAKRVKRIHPVKKLRNPRRLLRAKEREIDEGLRVIYGEEREDLSVVEKGRSRVTYWLSRAVGVLALLAGVILLALFLSSRGLFLNTSLSPLPLSIHAPEVARSGEEMTITVSAKNPESTDLARLDVDVNLPPAFLLTTITPEPTNAETLLFSFTDVKGGEEQVITLVGTWIVSVPSVNSIQAVANYRPANFSSDFSQVASTSVETMESVARVDITGPAEAVPGEAVSYEAKMTNTGSLPLQNPALRLMLPEGFVPSSTTPILREEDGTTFTQATVGAGETMTVSVTGAFASDVTDSRTVTAEALFPGKDGELLVQETDEVETAVTGGVLRLTLVGNGLTGDVATAPGEDLRLSFRLENVGTTPVDDAQVVLDFQPESGIPLVWSGANLDHGVLTKDGVVFDEKTIGVVNPGEKKSFNLSFPVKSELKEGDLDRFSVVARARLAGTTIQSSPLSLVVNAAVSFSSQAHYFSSDGVPIGAGPLPPVVGEPTTFEIMWTLTHALHPLEDVTVTATLPPGVTYAGGGMADTGSVSYDPGTNTVRFAVNTTTSATGELHAKFFVEATPSASDEGKTMKILSESTLRVTDTVTEDRLERHDDALTTALPDDPFAAGKGIVASP